MASRGNKLTRAIVLVGEGVGLAAGGLLGVGSRVVLVLADGADDVVARVGVGNKVSEDGARLEAVGEARALDGDVPSTKVGSLGVGGGRGSESEEGGGELHFGVWVGWLGGLVGVVLIGSR